MESARVRSNVRCFSKEAFAVWRCPHCRSIHARDQVDLAFYYANYPIHHPKPSRIATLHRDRLLRRLVRAGLLPKHAVLDFGCGSGVFVDHLRNRGFLKAAGYDPFEAKFAAPSVLGERYSFILAMDVLEHDSEPLRLLRRFDELLSPGGCAAVGTPNADAIDLRRPEESIHELHQPYHRAIFSKAALLEAGRRLGWQLVRCYGVSPTDTWIPCLNSRFWRRYAKTLDDTLDVAFEPFRPSFKLFTPAAVLDAGFGGFLTREANIMAVFRKPSS